LLKLSLNKSCNSSFFIVGGGQVKSFDYQTSGQVWLKGSSQLLPQDSPLIIGQQLLLPLTVQKGSRLAAQAINHMAIVDAASPPQLLMARHINPG